MPPNTTTTTNTNTNAHTNNDANNNTDTTNCDTNTTGVYNKKECVEVTEWGGPPTPTHTTACDKLRDNQLATLKPEPGALATPKSHKVPINDSSRDCLWRHWGRTTNVFSKCQGDWVESGDVQV